MQIRAQTARGTLLFAVYLFVVASLIALVAIGFSVQRCILGNRESGNFQGSKINPASENYRTHINSDLGFSFQYPVKWGDVTYSITSDRSLCRSHDEVIASGIDPTKVVSEIEVIGTFTREPDIVFGAILQNCEPRAPSYLDYLWRLRGVAPSSSPADAVIQMGPGETIAIWYAKENDGMWAPVASAPLRDKRVTGIGFRGPEVVSPEGAPTIEEVRTSFSTTVDFINMVRSFHLL